MTNDHGMSLTTSDTVEHHVRQYHDVPCRIVSYHSLVHLYSNIQRLRPSCQRLSLVHLRNVVGSRGN